MTEIGPVPAANGDPAQGQSAAGGVDAQSRNRVIDEIRYIEKVFGGIYHQANGPLADRKRRARNRRQTARPEVTE